MCFNWFSRCCLYTWHFVYLQFISCTFCSDFWETLNIIKSSFGKCKESAKKSVKAKIKQTLLRIFLKNEQRSHFLNKTSVEGSTRSCFWFRVVAIKTVFPFLKKKKNTKQIAPWQFRKICRHPATFLGRLRHRCSPVNLQNF